MPAGERYFNSGKPKASIDKDTVLIVEGKDDAYFIDSLLHQLGADPTRVGVVFITGKDALEENLAQLKKSRRFTEGSIRRIGIFRDADDSGPESLNAVQTALRNQGLAVPEQGQLSSSAGSPEIGIFIIPTSDEDGDLEKLCLSTISNDPRLKRVVEFVDLIQSEFGKLNHIFKRRSMTYFAVSPTENRGVGWTFSTTEMFDRDHPNLENLKTFLSAIVA